MAIMRHSKWICAMAFCGRQHLAQLEWMAEFESAYLNNFFFCIFILNHLSVYICSSVYTRHYHFGFSPLWTFCTLLYKKKHQLLNCFGFVTFIQSIKLCHISSHIVFHFWKLNPTQSSNKSSLKMLAVWMYTAMASWNDTAGFGSIASSLPDRARGSSTSGTCTPSNSDVSGPLKSILPSLPACDNWKNLFGKFMYRNDLAGSLSPLASLHAYRL